MNEVTLFGGLAQIERVCIKAILTYHPHIISYHIISYHIISYHIISYHILSYHQKHGQMSRDVIEEIQDGCNFVNILNQIRNCKFKKPSANCDVCFQSILLPSMLW